MSVLYLGDLSKKLRGIFFQARHPIKFHTQTKTGSSERQNPQKDTEQCRLYSYM